MWRPRRAGRPAVTQLAAEARLPAGSPPPCGGGARGGGGRGDGARAPCAPPPQPSPQGEGARGACDESCAQLHQRRQEARQRLAGAGRGDQQHRAAGARLRAAVRAGARAASSRGSRTSGRTVSGSSGASTRSRTDTPHRRNAGRLPQVEAAATVRASRDHDQPGDRHALLGARRGFGQIAARCRPAAASAAPHVVGAMGIAQGRLQPHARSRVGLDREGKQAARREHAGHGGDDRTQDRAT